MARLGGTATPDFTGGERGQIHGSVVEVRYRGRTVRGAMFPVAGHPDDVRRCTSATAARAPGTCRRRRAASTPARCGRRMRCAFGTGAQIALTGDDVPARLRAVSPPDGRTRPHPRRAARRARGAEERSSTSCRRCGPCSPTSRRKPAATSGACRSTSTRAPAATPASSRARPENNIPVVGKDEVHARPRDALAPRRHAITRATSRTRRPTSSRCPACTARPRRASPSARSAQPCTAAKA